MSKFGREEGKEEERKPKKKKTTMAKKRKKKRMFWLNRLSLSKFVCEFAKFASHRDFILTSSFRSLSFTFSLFFLARLVCVLCYTFIAQPSLWMSKIRERERANKE